MDNQLNNSRDHFIQGMSRISTFWGFPSGDGRHLWGHLPLARTRLAG